MSEEPKPDETETQAETLEEAIEESPASSDGKAKRGGAVAAWLALFIAVCALVAAGFAMYSNWQSSDSAAEDGRALGALQQRLQESQDSQQALLASVETLVSKSDEIEAAIGRVQSDVDDRVRMLDSLPARMSNLEASVASLRGLSAGARNVLLLAEAEYYMQIANAQLQLAGNPELAALALGMADDRVVQMADPALTDVRRALSDELAALAAMDKPDIEGVTLTLASLSRVVESLPLAKVADPRQEAQAIDPDAGRMSRAWSAVKGVFSGMVTVSKVDDADRPLLAPDNVYFLRTNLALQLQAARLALLRGEKSVFEQSLDDADAWIGEYFDSSSAQVASARETIAEIRNGMFAITPPDISESLRLLRQYQTLAESSE